LNKKDFLTSPGTFMFATVPSAEKVKEKCHKLLEKGKTEKALQLFEDVLKKDPGNFDLLLGFAGIYSRLQESQAALREYRKAFKAHPGRSGEILDLLSNPPGQLGGKPFAELRFEILVHRRDFGLALEVISEIEEDTVMRLLQRSRNRLDELKRISRNGEEAPLVTELTYSVALILEQQGEYSEAFSQYTAILECREEEAPHLVPRMVHVAEALGSEAKPFLSLGKLLRVSDPEKSTRYYNKALDLDPRTAKAVIDQIRDGAEGALDHWLLGRAYLLTEAWSEAASTLGKISAASLRSAIIKLLQGLDPSVAGAEPTLLLLGDLLLAEKRPSEAARTLALLTGRVESRDLRERFDQIIKLDPDNPHAREAFVEVCLDENDLTRSIPRMRQALESDPTQAEGLFDKLFPLMEDNFEDPELCLFLAELSLNEDRAARPLVLLRRYVQLEPDNAERCLPLLEQLVKNHPAHPLIRIAQGEAHLVSGSRGKALQSFKVALSLAPESYIEALHHLSVIVQKAPEHCREVQGLLYDLEESGICAPALDLVSAESALAAGDYERTVERALRCAAAAPDKIGAVVQLVRHWRESCPGQIVLALGLAELSCKTGGEAQAVDTLKQVLREDPEAAEKVLAGYRGLLKKYPGSLPINAGMLETYLQCGFYDLVLEEGKKLAQRFRPPEIAVIHKIMGDARREMGHFTGAVSLYYQAFKDDPSSGEIIAARIRALLKIHPSLPGAALALGVILPAAGQVKEGVTALMDLARELPEHRKAAFKYLRHISKTHPMAQEPILALAELHTLVGDYDRALKLLWKAMQREGGNSDVILHLLDHIERENPVMAPVQVEIGKAYLSVGLSGKAADHFAQSVEIDSAYSEQAIKFCHDIIAAYPGELKAYEAISNILVGLGRREAAVTFLRTAGETRPEVRGKLLPVMERIANAGPQSPQVLNALAWGYLGAERRGEAVSAMSKAVALEPSLAKAGVTFFSELLSRKPDNADAQLERGRCRMHSLDLLQSFRDIRAAIEFAPEKIDVGIELLELLKQKGLDALDLYLFLGKLYSQKQHYEKAIAVLEAGCQVPSPDEDKFPLFIRLAETHERKGDMNAARTCLQESKALAPDLKHYYRKLHEFSLKTLRFETRLLEQKAGQSGVLTPEEIKKLIDNLVLQDKEETAEELVRQQVSSLEPQETRLIWGYFYEATGRYGLAAQFADDTDFCRRAYLLEKAGESVLAASLLEQAIKENPDPVLQERLKHACLSLMEASLRKEKHPLMGETRLRISDITETGA
jgi:tetratricopeptide (TPR) repeat protein